VRRLRKKDGVHDWRRHCNEFLNLEAEPEDFNTPSKLPIGLAAQFSLVVGCIIAGLSMSPICSWEPKW
jgi:hypothetical protein